jgi:NADPH2:quinone reductase
MKAVELNRFGDATVLDIVESPMPDPGPRQVLIRVRAAGVNFADTLMRENRYALTPVLPAILGHEVAGVVERLGSDVKGLTVGARVAAPLFAAGAWFGGYAEYVVIDADIVVPLPAGLSFDVATALMVQGLTALYLTRHADPQGKSVLVNAAAGGVGTLLVQLARRAGARTVIAAASTDEKLDLARQFGADAAVNYSRPEWVEQVRALGGGAGVDIVYESAGGEVTKGSLKALGPLGEIVIYGALNIQSFDLGVPELLRLIFSNQSITGFALATLLTTESLRSGLSMLFDLAVRGQLHVKIGGRFPLDRVADAHRALEGRQTTGKIVLAA